MIKLTKKKIILFSIIIIIIIIPLILLLTIFSQKNRVLRKIYGKYEIVEYLYSVNGAILSSTPEPIEPSDSKAVVNIQKNKISAEGSDYNIYPEYVVKKVDKKMLENGIDSQGTALQNGIMSYSVRQNLKTTSYAIFIDEPAEPDMIPPDNDSLVYYYIDGVLYQYSAFKVFRLQKIA